ncbi:hypothetical protein AgCh_023068 [Apium graveolens]
MSSDRASGRLGYVRVLPDPDRRNVLDPGYLDGGDVATCLGLFQVKVEYFPGSCYWALIGPFNLDRRFAFWTVGHLDAWDASEYYQIPTVGTFWIPGAWTVVMLPRVLGSSRSRSPERPRGLGELNAFYPSSSSSSSSSVEMPPRVDQPQQVLAQTLVLGPGGTLSNPDGSWEDVDEYFVQCRVNPKPGWVGR